MTELVVAEPGEFADLELLVRLYLRQITLDGVPVTVTDEPRNPLAPPVVTVLQLPGPGPTSRRSWETTRRIETASMGTLRAQSRAMNAQIEKLMWALPGSGFMGVLVDKPLGQNTSPGQVPYGDDVRRMPIVWDLVQRKHKGQRVVVDI